MAKRGYKLRVPHFDPERVFTIAEVCDELKISRSSFYRYFGEVVRTHHGIGRGDKTMLGGVQLNDFVKQYAWRCFDAT